MVEKTPIAAAEDPDWQVRARAAVDLSRLRDPAAQSALERLLKDDDGAVSDAATEALVESLGMEGLRIALRNWDDDDRGDDLVDLLRVFGFRTIPDPALA